MNSAGAASATARLDQTEARHADEVSHGERFEFGKNWSHFLSRLNDDRIQRAEKSLSEMLGVQTLSGKRFLDVGSGSGLFSLAARRLGATVHSFDYDPNSVACARELRRRYFPEDRDWTVEEGSALDGEYLQSLGSFDVVYAWGVLHHTGRMWDALGNVRSLVAPGGLLFIAIYNDKGSESNRWRELKRIYCSLPRPVQPIFAALTMLPYEVKDVARSVMSLRPQEYIHSWTRYSSNRGMSRWHDVIDWAGGYPYEVATADEIIEFYGRAGFAPRRVNRTNGLGCNEFVFARTK